MVRPLVVIASSLVLTLVVACPPTAPADAGPVVDDGPVWTPGISLPTARGATARGFLDRKGLIHAHSVYSHDACDGEPVDDAGVRDQACLADFRHAICATKMDFVFLTDHRESFDETEFPDTLLFDPARGDALVDRGGPFGAAANRAACDDDEHETLIMGGCETNDMMPVGVEGHPVETGRGDLYGVRTSEHIATLHEAGALIMFAHPENLTADEIIESELDGYEMYNLHRNLFAKAGEALDLALRIAEQEEGLPHPDLAAIRILSLDDEYLEKWARVTAAGVKKVTTVGTDCHQNTFPGLMEDGERIDSYRRMMSWMSNHLLVEPEADGTYDDRHLKDALKNRRLYGAFELYGPPTGFDFHAKTAGGVVEMGGVVALADAPVLVVALPTVDGLDPSAKAPEISARLLRAEANGTWTEVATSSSAELRYPPDVAGAYRVEVRIVPHHLDAYLGADDHWALSRDHAWVLANAIFVE